MHLRDKHVRVRSYKYVVGSTYYLVLAGEVNNQHTLLKACTNLLGECALFAQESSVINMQLLGPWFAVLGSLSLVVTRLVCPETVSLITLLQQVHHV